LHRRTKIRKDRLNSCGDIVIFVIFKRAAAAIWNFQKIKIFSCRSAVRGQYAQKCQTSSKSVKRLQKYGDLTVFKMAAVRHVGFLKFKYFNNCSGYELRFASPYQILYRSVQPLRRYRDFCHFQDGGSRHLGFVGRILGPPIVTTWGLYRCAKFC